MELELEGKVAVVTGAGRGIGLAVSRRLLEEGARVVAGARRATPELAALAEIGDLRVHCADLTMSGAPEGLADLAGDRIDVLVNNVGAAPVRTGGFLAITDEQWLATLSVNLMVAVRTTRSVLPRMFAAGQGAVVNVSSVNAFLPDPDVMDYCSAKAALSNFSKALSKQVGPHGVRVNDVCPGPVETDLWLGPGGVASVVAAAAGTDPETVRATVAGATVTGRFSRPDEVADLVLLLASERTANVTGSSFTIDGGLVTTL